VAGAYCFSGKLLQSQEYLSIVARRSVKQPETSSSYTASSDESPKYPTAHSLLSGGVPTRL
jgi:hypothetical protein